MSLRLSTSSGHVLHPPPNPSLSQIPPPPTSTAPPQSRSHAAASAEHHVLHERRPQIHRAPLQGSHEGLAARANGSKGSAGSAGSGASKESFSSHRAGRNRSSIGKCPRIQDVDQDFSGVGLVRVVKGSIASHFEGMGSLLVGNMEKRTFQTEV